MLPQWPRLTASWCQKGLSSAGGTDLLGCLLPGVLTAGDGRLPSST